MLDKAFRSVCSLEVLLVDDGAKKNNSQDWPLSDKRSDKIKMGARPGTKPNKVWSAYSAVHPICCYRLAAPYILLFCDPMDCSPPGSSVHSILRARILELVATSYSRA